MSCPPACLKAAQEEPNLAKRIYALAKELNLESKELVEICPRAGVDGKSSALASLTEEEVEQIKSYLKQGSQPASGSATSSAAPSRSSRPAPRSKDASSSPT